MKKLTLTFAVTLLTGSLLAGAGQAGGNEKIIDFSDRGAIRADEVRYVSPEFIMGLVWAGHECEREEILSRVDARMERYNYPYARRFLSRLENAVGECSEETTDHDRGYCICTRVSQISKSCRLEFVARWDDRELDSCDRAAESYFQTVLIVVNDYLERHPELDSGTFWTCLVEQDYNGFDEIIFDYCSCMAEAVSSVDQTACIWERDGWRNRDNSRAR